MPRSAASDSPAPDANRWEKTPEVNEATEILLEHDTAGDPITGIRGTHKTPAGIAELLRQLNIEISANTVARLLHDMDYSSPDRGQQFRYISSLHTRLECPGISIISVDTKKRELAGNFKNNGVKWDRTPVLRQCTRFPFRCYRSRYPLWYL